MAERRISKLPPPPGSLPHGYIIQKPAVITPADYGHLKRLEVWTIEQGICGLLNIAKVPDRDINSGRCKSSEEDEVFSKYWKIVDVASTSINAEKLRLVRECRTHVDRALCLKLEVSPADFVTWARSKGYPIPTELEMFDLDCNEGQRPQEELQDKWRNNPKLSLMFHKYGQKYVESYLAEKGRHDAARDASQMATNAMAALGLPVVDAISSTKPERRETEINRWLRETWESEGKPTGGPFFRALKKHQGKLGSPIVEWYGAGKDAGIKWETSGGATGEWSKHTIETRISEYRTADKNKTSQ